MPDLPAIDDSNTFATKSDDEAVPSGEETTHVAAADLNNIKARLSENRTQANTALSTAEATAVAVSSLSDDLDEVVTDLETHEGDTTNPHGVTAAQVVRTNVRVSSGAVSIASSDADGEVAITPSSGAVATFPDSLEAGFRVRITRGAGGATGGNVTFASSGSRTATFTGVERLTDDGESCIATCVFKDGTDIYWQISGSSRPAQPVTLSASTTLSDWHSGKVIFVDTSGAVTLTLPHTVADGWNAVIVREGANTLTITGSGGMLLKGPAAASDEVAIAVDNGGVSVLVRSATKAWAAGVAA